MTDLIEMWHKRARPTPTQADFNTQLGCHVEEFIEMLDSLYLQVNGTTLDYDIEHMYVALTELAKGLKANQIDARILRREDFLDAIADQVVTGVGAAHCAGMRPTEALRRVNQSNWSKFDSEGQPLRDVNGKIAKGLNYKAPDLNGLY
jgi:predicted HAD superfamily Cof-like phosphohydrolase